jgi:Protein of unknown function (DUF3455)
MENCMRNYLLKSVPTLALAFTLAPQPARAEQVTPPPVPPAIQVPAGNKAFLVGHAIGTQNYICLPSVSASGFAWTLFGPQATLFNDDGGQIITHFLSPNPSEADTPRATWQHSRDTSSVWAMAINSSAVPNAIPWLLLQRVGVQDGPTSGDRLTKTSYIHRVNTVGGLAPATGCDLSTNVGSRAFVPYTADYFFYRDRRGPDDDD